MSTEIDPHIDPHIDRLLKRDSFIERGARSRARALLDPGSMRELAGPFERLHSPWLAMQQLVTQADDGVVVAKGRLDGHPTVVLAIEGAYQGGSMGEIGGAKIAGSLELAARDNRRGIPTRAVILFETGGVRLQEANLGLASIAEIQSAVVDLRRYQPVIGVSAGTVGCYGGMSIVAGLCSWLVLTREARLGLNGPQVIEQEAGVAEFDARKRDLIWGLTGGAQRVAAGLADACVQDDTAEVRATVARLFAQGLPAVHRSERADAFLASLERVDTARQPTPEDVRTIYRHGDA
ncbi:biotin-independent malonate decarboxylase subunit beta [Massilia sp. LXY-6]|uniref:biotin-independent malonate decarboxylase subunit beta n=1 Tax=Massilia sp. LXY-6 TaxID=3379823 RepID=UPI003EDEFE91